MTHTLYITHTALTDTQPNGGTRSRCADVQRNTLTVTYPIPPHKSNDSKGLLHLGALVCTTPLFFIC